MCFAYAVVSIIWWSLLSSSYEQPFALNLQAKGSVTVNVEKCPSICLGNFFLMQRVPIQRDKKNIEQKVSIICVAGRGLRGNHPFKLFHC